MRKGPALIERVRTAVTDPTGQYRIVDLRPGTYAVVFSLTGFSTVRREGIELSGTFVATINGDLVTIHNIRNFDYRTETDFTSRYYTKTFDLRQLDSVDVIASYWMGDAIAHIFLSFGFSGKDFIAISIETRRQRH